MVAAAFIRPAISELWACDANVPKKSGEPAASLSGNPQFTAAMVGRIEEKIIRSSKIYSFEFQRIGLFFPGFGLLGREEILHSLKHSYFYLVLLNIN
jgi:hypothetical protein